MALGLLIGGQLSMVVHGQKLDERLEQLTTLSFGRKVKLGEPCLDVACIVDLN